MKRNLLFRLITSFLMVGVVIGSSGTAHAFTVAPAPDLTNREKAHRNIIFTGGGNTGSTCDVSGTTNTSSSENPRIAFEFFVKKGFTDKQAAGIIGNFMLESGVNPKRVQGAGVIESETLPSSGGYGIAQWDDRKPLLKKFADEIDKKKRPIYDLGLQLDFVIWELKNTESAAYAAFIKTTTITDATTVWMEKYERPGVQALPERIGAANKAFGDYATGDSTGQGKDPLADDTGSPIADIDDSGCGAGSGDIVGIALAELRKRVVEDPIGCDAGNPSIPGDCGDEVNKYTDRTLEYWCADFVSWVYKTAGSPFTGGASGGWRLPSVEGVQAWMEENGRFYTGKPNDPDPQPGDVYVINDGEHIGIVVKVESGNLYTVSGNTSTENYSNGVGVGDTVYNDFRRNPSITGWGGLR